VNALSQPAGHPARRIAIFNREGGTMFAFAIDPWLRFGLGVLTGCWIGGVVGLGVALILAGRRLRQLELANTMLRAKLRVRDKSRQAGEGGGGPILVVPQGVNRPASAPLGRVASSR
jgi:hypothetical protein